MAQIGRLLQIFLCFCVRPLLTKFEGKARERTRHERGGWGKEDVVAYYVWRRERSAPALSLSRSRARARALDRRKRPHKLGGEPQKVRAIESTLYVSAERVASLPLPRVASSRGTRRD